MGKQTDSQTDKQTDRRTDRGIAQCPPTAVSIINTPQMTSNLKDVSDLLRREHGCIKLAAPLSIGIVHSARTANFSVNSR